MKKLILIIGIIGSSFFVQNSLFAANKRITLTTAWSKPYFGSHIEDKDFHIGKDPKRATIRYKLEYLDGSTWVSYYEDEVIYEAGNELNGLITRLDAKIVDTETFLLQEIQTYGTPLSGESFAGTIE